MAMAGPSTPQQHVACVVAGLPHSTRLLPINGWCGHPLLILRTHTQLSSIEGNLASPRAAVCAAKHSPCGRNASSTQLQQNNANDSYPRLGTHRAKSRDLVDLLLVVDLRPRRAVDVRDGPAEGVSLSAAIVISGDATCPSRKPSAM